MRLIDADALWEIIRTWQARLKPEYFITDRVKSDVLNTVIVTIESQPTIDAEPVRHGRWVRKDESQVMFDIEWRCSVCGSEISTDGIYKPYALGWKRCYNCGAKMDGGKNNGDA